MFVLRVPLSTLILGAMLVAFPAIVRGQDAPARKDASSLQQTQFAPGVITVVPPAPEPQETVTGPIPMKAFLDS